uniref:Peptidase M14 domain-containing protein n=1 Tax=Anopheles maculatus TaxID=74869 RepID=A0A182T6H6_9DIPT
MALTVQRFPDRASVEKLGETALGRDINMMVINPHAAKTVILIANLHAREWATMTSAIYIITELVHNGTKYPELNDIRWMIMPISNPDGYEYTRETDRYWSKNRSPQPGGTYGVDLNGNFGHMWDKNDKPSNPEDRTYRGPRPFSEEETVAISALLEELAFDTILYVDMHSFGNHIYYPWGFTREPTPDAETAKAVAFAGADAIRAKFEEYYTVGTPSSFDEKQIDFAEQLESVAYVLCGDGTVTYDKFCQIWHAKGILDKLYRLIDVDSTNLVSTNQIMEFISNLTNSRSYLNQQRNRFYFTLLPHEDASCIDSHQPNRNRRIMADLTDLMDSKITVAPIVPSPVHRA